MLLLLGKTFERLFFVVDAWLGGVGGVISCFLLFFVFEDFEEVQLFCQVDVLELYRRRLFLLELGIIQIF